MKTGEQFIWLLERYVTTWPFQHTAYQAIPGSPNEEQTRRQCELMLRTGIIEPAGSGFRVTEKGRRVLDDIRIRQGIGPAGTYWVGG
jgi:hypothetical protein